MIESAGNRKPFHGKLSIRHVLPRRFGWLIVCVVTGCLLVQPGIAAGWPNHQNWSPICGSYPNVYGQYQILLTAPNPVDQWGGGVLTFYPNGTIGGQTGWEYVYWMGQLLWQGSDGQWNSQWAESWMARLAGGGVAPWMHYGPDTGYKWAFSGRWGTDTMGFNVYPGRTYFLRSLIWWNSQPYAYPPAGGLDLEDIGSCTYNLSGASRASRLPKVTVGRRPARRPPVLTPTNMPCTIRGDRRSNVLRGTRHFDVICGGGGNDTVITKGGGDVVLAGPGNDKIVLSGGDYAFGQGGNDKFYARNGKVDYIDGGGGRDAARIDRGLDRGKGPFKPF